MAEEKKLVISLDASGAIRTVRDLTEEMADLNTQTDKIASSSEKASKNIDDIGKSSKKGVSSISNLTGSLVKGLGIVTLISKGFELFSGALMKNQKVADTVNTAMTTVSIILSEVVGVVVDVITKVGEATGGFDALGKVVSGLITIALTPLKAAFFGIKLAILELQLAWEESFFGDEDPETIKDLNKRISETKDSLIEVGEDAIEAGKKVVDNFIPAVQSIGQVIEGTIEGVSKIDVKAAAAQAKALTQLQNNAILAQAQAARLAEQYDRQAEKLRQIRDDESLSIPDRIKANQELGDVLNKQEKALLQQADAGVAVAQANLQVNNTIENQAALTEALTQKDAVLAQVEGLRSEQKVNEVALNKELIELDKARLKSSSELAIKQQKFDASLVDDKLKRLEIERGILEQEKVIELERLQNNINLYKEGTQARVDAEVEFATKKQEIDNQIAKNEKDIADEKKTREEAAKKKADEDRQKEIEAERAATQQKFDIANAGLNALSSLNDLFTTLETNRLKKGEKASVELQKKQFKRGKALAVAQTGINTAQAIVRALADPGGIPGTILSVAAGITGAAQIAAILAKKFNPETGDTGGGDTGTTSTPSLGGAGQSSFIAPPTFSLGGQQIGGAGNILGTGGGSQAQQPIKVFVSETDISNVQGKVQVTQGNSLFGGGG